MVGDRSDTARIADFGPWLKERILAPKATGWMAEADGLPAACALVWLRPHQPNPRTGATAVPYVFNVHCQPARRRRGHTRVMMDQVLDRVAMQASIRSHSMRARMGALCTRTWGSSPRTRCACGFIKARSDS